MRITLREHPQVKTYKVSYVDLDPQPQICWLEKGMVINMNYQNRPTGSPVKVVKLNIFSILAFGSGILAALSISTIFISIALGSLAVIFAVISKGYDKRMNRVSLNGLWLGLAAIIFSIVIVFSNIYLYIYDDAYRGKFNELYEELYGTSFDEYLQEAFPSSDMIHF